MIAKKYINGGLLLGLIGLASCLMLNVRTAAAEIPDPTDEQLTLISQNCTQIKSTLQQLNYNDTLARVNQGQLYTEIITNLITPMNKRITTNRYDLGEMGSTSNEFATQFANFRSQYSTYATDLQNVLSQDCGQAKSFYAKLVTAQQSRIELGKTVKQMNNLLTQYRKQLLQFSNSTLNNDKAEDLNG